MVSDEQIVQANDETFDQAVMKSEVPALVDFWAPWCSPCHRVAPIFEEISREYSGRVQFVKVNVDEGGTVASSIGIASIPTLILFDRGRIVDRKVGVQPKAVLEEMILGILKEAG